MRSRHAFGDRWKRPGRVPCAAAAAGAALAWTGHGTIGEGAIGWLHRGADVALIAAGLWIGALLGLSMLVMRRAEPIVSQAGGL